MQPRTLIFEDDPALRQLLRTVLTARGHEVLDFAAPIACALLTEKRCSCPRDVACADILLTDMRMPSMTGLELLRLQAAMGCKAPPENKVLVSAQLGKEQQAELAALGSRFLPKPFHIGTLIDFIEACEERIPAGRKLTDGPLLMETVLKASA
jgi:CheY-like chemotaxis protein